jgi:hypothetical protein
VDCPTLDSLYAGAKLELETFGNLTRRFVGKSENANAPGIDRELLDEESDALDEAEGLSRARPGENEQWLCGGLDRGALRSRRDAGNRSGAGSRRRRCSDERWVRQRESVRARARDRQVSVVR